MRFLIEFGGNWGVFLLFNLDQSRTFVLFCKYDFSYQMTNIYQEVF